MEMIVTDVHWLAVVVGAVVSFLFGWFWYSPMAFGTKWAAGARIDQSKAKEFMPKAMAAQIMGTILLAWTVGVLVLHVSTGAIILMAIAFAFLVKANGLYAQKNCYATFVEAGFVLSMTLIMLAIQTIL